MKVQAIIFIAGVIILSLVRLRLSADFKGICESFYLSFMSTEMMLTSVRNYVLRLSCSGKQIVKLDGVNGTTLNYRMIQLKDLSNIYI